MATHSNLTGVDLHEPKGVGSASALEVYYADGAGSGSWKTPVQYIGGHVPFDDTTPAYQHSVTTSDTVIDPTFTVTHASGFTATSTPNARLIYTGVSNRHITVSFNASLKQSSGGDKDIEIVVYKNGVAQETSRVVRTAGSGAWGSVSLGFDCDAVTNDYFEFFIKADATATTNFAQMYTFIQGHVE